MFDLLHVARVIQKVRLASPDNFEELQKELKANFDSGATFSRCRYSNENTLARATCAAGSDDTLAGFRTFWQLSWRTLATNRIA